MLHKKDLNNICTERQTTLNAISILTGVPMHVITLFVTTNNRMPPEHEQRILHWGYESNSFLIHRINEFRERMNLSKGAFTRAMDIGHSTLLRWEDRESVPNTTSNLTFRTISTLDKKELLKLAKATTKARNKRKAASKLPPEGLKFFREKHRVGPSYILALRTAMRITQTEFGAMLSLSGESIGQWERSIGRPQAEAKRQIKEIGQWFSKTQDDIRTSAFWPKTDMEIVEDRLEFRERVPEQVGMTIGPRVTDEPKKPDGPSDLDNLLARVKAEREQIDSMLDPDDTEDLLLDIKRVTEVLSMGIEEINNRFDTVFTSMELMDENLSHRIKSLQKNIIGAAAGGIVGIVLIGILVQT